MTYPIQNQIHIPSCIDDCRVAAQLQDFTQHAHKFVLEGLQVRCQNAWSLFEGHFASKVVIGRRQDISWNLEDC